MLEVSMSGSSLFQQIAKKTPAYHCMQCTNLIGTDIIWDPWRLGPCWWPWCKWRATWCCTCKRNWRGPTMPSHDFSSSKLTYEDKSCFMNCSMRCKFFLANVMWLELLIFYALLTNFENCITTLITGSVYAVCFVWRRFSNTSIGMLISWWESVVRKLQILLQVQVRLIPSKYHTGVIKCYRHK